ncbi:Ldh family oxidoreductase [Chloroflexi bacterium TSY]|nr:Ldh family oxidoreductase [Chloroflexi bacterium TSY]
MNATHTIKATELQTITQRFLVSSGTPQHIADIVADVLVGANLTGHDSHGVLRIPHYLDRVANGTIQPAAEPEILQETNTTLKIDGQHGFGHYTAQKGMEWAIQKAKESNVCGVSFINIGHIGRLGQYAEQAAEAGCIGLITYGTGRSDRGGTVPFGGKEGRLGTNPMAAGVPTGDESPFVLDIATSIVAEGKLQVARSKNQDLPEGYIVDKEGSPSIKTADFYDGGHLLPFGGHKGYGLSLLICLLGGLCANFDSTNSGMGGTFMQVINIDAFMPLAQYQRNVRAFLDGMKATPPAAGFEQVLAPGDFEHMLRTQRLSEGIELPNAIYEQLQDCAERLGISLGSVDI